MPMQRSDSLRRVRENARFDAVVIGGGINGLGVYRDLSLQGLRVLLVERNDFCSGCSAAPSRMIHGGLRYLENGEFGLVRESLAERDALLRNAPHMVRPLPTTVPIVPVLSGLWNAAASFLGRTGRPARRGAVPIKLGLSLYDFVSRTARQLPPHRFRSARKTREIWPDLFPDLTCSATYHDAWISYPERLGIELMLDAVETGSGSAALNYAEVVREGDGHVLIDRETGDRLPLTPRIIVNAAGAWVDEVRNGLSPGGGNVPFVTGTKGSHLILDNPDLERALGGHMMFFENVDGRVCIVFPYLGRVLAGSTDIRVSEVTRTRCEPDERDYILVSLRRLFPGIAVGEEDIVFSYSGIRPLPTSDADFTGRISRGHFVRRVDGPVPQFCMIGGKWTTFRAFATETSDMVLAELGTERQVDTRDLAIGGGRDFRGAAPLAQALVDHFGISGPRAAHLVDLYGSRADDVMAYCAAATGDHPLARDLQMTSAEIAWLIRHEQVVHLSDIVLRRTPLAITGRIDRALVDAIASIAAAELGWSDDETHAQCAALVAELDAYHGVSPRTLDQRTQNRSSTACASVPKPA
ncbi:glycerol-3-phosphate dehydrogenase/oxidase [Chachezhania antarctica]|uniref:glycerol-3-phosphate dehydrogenase/oxidase n=1 Tax=Chachezhania antarctica TaxID=2340860 RepID=UPI000EB014D2|nr:glycerol-3-phosphate dehydrogenase/oxidase [Chachezhania antarctica]|tara:strand:+ start:2525 stop:4270 length:1746 start_codon:yes stop_codon:yes gene_type:complete